MASNDDELVDVLQTASQRRRTGAQPPAPEPVADPVPVAEPLAGEVPPAESVLPPTSPALPTIAIPEQESVPVAQAAPAPLPKQVKESPLAPAASLPATPTDYISQLLKSNRNKKGKTIQLDPDNHRALTHIANTMGGITIADLLHNIVRLHFQEYGPAIQQMLKEKEALNKKDKLPFQRP